MREYDITTREGLALAASDIVESMRRVPSAFLFLSGDLGSGKTTLTQEVARIFGVTDAVQSPTYSLLKTYTLPETFLHHLDLYRVESLHELEAAGIIDLMATGTGYFVVEWPKFLEGIVPYSDLVVQCTLQLREDGTRTLTMTI